MRKMLVGLILASILLSLSVVVAEEQKELLSASLMALAAWRLIPREISMWLIQKPAVL